MHVHFTSHTYGSNSKVSNISNPLQIYRLISTTTTIIIIIQMWRGRERGTESEIYWIARDPVLILLVQIWNAMRRLYRHTHVSYRDNHAHHTLLPMKWTSHLEKQWQLILKTCDMWELHQAFKMGALWDSWLTLTFPVIHFPSKFSQKSECLKFIL